MSPIVIDTNVVLVANNSHDDVSPECVLECARRLEELMRSGAIVIDDMFRILGEYQKRTAPRKGKGVGDVFVKWVLTMLGDTSRVHQVTLQELGEDRFAEFPVPELEAAFDRPDRKFVAVANAHPDKPPVLQAADCKWVDWWPQLKRSGVRVVFLCEEDVCRFYRNKFPRKGAPVLP